MESPERTRQRTSREDKPVGIPRNIRRRNEVGAGAISPWPGRGMTTNSVNLARSEASRHFGNWDT